MRADVGCFAIEVEDVTAFQTGKMRVMPWGGFFVGGGLAGETHAGEAAVRDAFLKIAENGPQSDAREASAGAFPHFLGGQWAGGFGEHFGEGGALAGGVNAFSLVVDRRHGGGRCWIDKLRSMRRAWLLILAS